LASATENLMTTLNSAFLIVRKFDALYRSHRHRTAGGVQIYSLPQEGTEPDAVLKKYRGLDREPVTGIPFKSLARMLRVNSAAVPIPVRAAQLAMDQLSITNGLEDHCVKSLDDARDVYLTLGTPEDWEIVWVRLAEEGGQVPAQSVRLGFEPSFYPGGFSPRCATACAFHAGMAQMKQAQYSLSITLG
jgi:hypothetical protein